MADSWITIEDLRRLVRYDADTGEMTLKPRTAADFPNPATDEYAARWNDLNAGKPAFASAQGEYRAGTIWRQRFLAHRVAFAIYHGRWPKKYIDHINGDASDNRIANLRDCDSRTNQRNRKIPCHNMSGVIGVRWDKRQRRWVVQIGANSTRRYVGCFKDFDEAVAARKKAEREDDYHENHGREGIAA